MKRCPKCGCETFYVSAYVIQEWKVDNNGNFIECTDNCEEVAHSPDDLDIWCCANCGYDDDGEAFNVREELR